MEAKDRIIVALDVNDVDKAKALVQELAPHVGIFKVGLELITSIGAPAAVALVKEAGGKVMFDGKFNDIPNTMAGATKAVAALGVEMFTVHASAGEESLLAVAENKGAAKALAVTVLTSFDEGGSCKTFGDSTLMKVPQFADAAKQAGLDGVVCSPRELSFLVHVMFDGLLRITPGVRPEWAATGDQKRVMTPHEAILAGADYLVIGRPILKPPPHVGSPAEAAQRIVAEIKSALLNIEARALSEDTTRTGRS